MKTTRTWIIIVSMLVFLCGKASAYCIFGSGCPQSGTGWPGDTATFHSNGFRGSNSSFNSAFIEALNQWNGLSNFSFSSINAAADPQHCAPNSTRGWEFNSHFCGSSFGSSTIAVSIFWWNSFTDELVDADIILNNAFTWDVHNGSGPNIDSRRIATHELGHALGLAHDNTFAALMNTTYSQSIETPQTDDINGLRAIYGNPNPEVMTKGDMDGNGQDEVIIDFGKAGIWIRMNNSTWVKLHDLSPEIITTGDMDGNGLDDVIIDFGRFGIHVRMNNSTWVQLPTL